MVKSQLMKIAGGVVTVLILCGCQIEQSGEQVGINQGVEAIEQENNQEEIEPIVLFQLSDLPEEELYNLSFLGREEEYDVYYSTSYYSAAELESGINFYFTNPSTFEVVKEGELEVSILPKIELIGHQIRVMNPQEMVIISNQFDEVECIKMPELIAKEEELYGFDVTEDLSQFVYSNQEGIWLLEGESEPILLRGAVTYPPNSLLEFGYYQNPTFINKEQEVIMDVSSYEGSAGYVFCNLQTLTCDQELSGTQQDLLDIKQNQVFLQLFKPTGAFDPWESKWLNLKTKTVLEQLPISFEVEADETYQIEDYLQLDQQLVLAIGTHQNRKFFPKWIDIELYQLEDDGTLRYVQHLERVEDIELKLIGLTKEGSVSYLNENYNKELGIGQVKITLTP